MGNCCIVEGAVDHWIYVKTGDRKGSGTDANLKCILYDNKGHQSQPIDLDCYFRSDFERGKTDVFQAGGLREFGDIDRIELWRDNPGVDPDWFCEVIVVNDRRTEKCYYFPVQRWMRPTVRYKIQQYDTVLPQLDPNRDQRQAELDEKRGLYQYGQTAPDLPVQVASLPADEQFSDEYKWDIMASKDQFLGKAGLPYGIMQGDWTGLDELTDLFHNAIFPEPVGMDRWSNDLCFGAQRLIGCNPGMIKLCSGLPENMGITAEMLRPFLEGWTLKQIIEAKRLFVVDHSILQDLPTKDDYPIPAPIGLFFVTGDKQLVPIAIQLYQDIRPNNPVFLPNDPPFTWLLAKMWFNLADATIHQSLSHFAFTHLLMEGINVATQRHLSPVHPIYKLLQPHFLFLLAINARSLDQLMAPGGWADECMNVGREGMFELMRRGCDEWRIDVQGTFQKDLETRGVLDPKTLPNYCYRDDGLLISKAIEHYVTKIVRYYYDSPQKIKDDYELQNWGAELATEKENGGVGIRGMPSRGRFKRPEEIGAVCGSIIFNCSVQHAAVNQNMYEEYAFPPNYTTFLEGDPPEDKLPRSEEDIVQSLPDRRTTIDTIAVTKLLSYRGDKSLGEWEFQFQYDPPALRAEKEFQEELQNISKTIKQRNTYRDDIYKYPYLDPETVPNNISI